VPSRRPFKPVQRALHSAQHLSSIPLSAIAYSRPAGATSHPRRLPIRTALRCPYLGCDITGTPVSLSLYIQTHCPCIVATHSSASPTNQQLPTTSHLDSRSTAGVGTPVSSRNSPHPLPQAQLRNTSRWETASPTHRTKSPQGKGRNSALGPLGDND
jgi:hypothetical protein